MEHNGTLLPRLFSGRRTQAVSSADWKVCGTNPASRADDQNLCIFPVFHGFYEIRLIPPLSIAGERTHENPA
jgi:hypothetical protein